VLGLLANNVNQPAWFRRSNRSLSQVGAVGASMLTSSIRAAERWLAPHGYGATLGQKSLPAVKVKMSEVFGESNEGN
jgi:hypothetical protein